MEKMFFRTLIIVVMLFLLNACSTTHKDGPPPFPVDETRVPDAVPKAEPRSKYGNYSSYKVFGRRYYTLSSSRNYHERGVASWYGTQFHSQRTSSGERYNMLGMTAAHKTLPLPTYVKVTNLRNGRHIIVKVNDRGPFESNRLIDLSYVGAKKLGMIGHGTAYVDVQAIDPERYNNPNYYYNNTKSNKRFYVQVGTFRNRAYAEQLRYRLGKTIQSPIQIKQFVHLKTKSPLYRVQIGPFNDTASAQRIYNHLKSMGLNKNQLT